MFRSVPETTKVGRRGALGFKHRSHGSERASFPATSCFHNGTCLRRFELWLIKSIKCRELYQAILLPNYCPSILIRQQSGEVSALCPNCSGRAICKTVPPSQNALITIKPPFTDEPLEEINNGGQRFGRKNPR
jgi:hypothetical protein